MKFTYFRLFTVLLFTILLSGCLYPQSERAENDLPNEAQLEMVQTAVETYRENRRGLVPIKTKGSDTPVFQKYLIDFTALQQANALTEIPGNAFENGGYYQYTLITPEDNPRVKLLDLRLTEAVRQVNVQMNFYRNEHIYPPFGEEIAEGVFTIDYQELGLESPPRVISPYSKENLPLVMDIEGNVYIDYRLDLTRALKEFGQEGYSNGEDLRYLLVEHTPFVPAYSLPYAVKDGEPVFSAAS
ncbi:hypothetical protein [Lentibacillus sediminis]|uniref:hypothetical protein n=1 Tax=Lentibacillus sediminis TaxID=1940529 RepID=UPI000C1C4E28|nr:hypothetical protein [Lentibacillus sediminis]